MPGPEIQAKLGTSDKGGGGGSVGVREVEEGTLTGLTNSSGENTSFFAI